MTTTMKALAVTEWGRRAKLCDMPRPQVDETSVIVQTLYSGVSAGTEMWIAAGKRRDYGDVPFVNGYQVTGTVAEIGGQVTRVAVGDLCAAFVAGAHSQFAKAREEHVHTLRAPELAKPAALFVPPSVGANALGLAGIGSDDVVLVIGQGLVGQATAQLARLRGAYVIATDVSLARLEYSRRYCADEVIDASQANVVETVRKRYSSGVDVVIESTGFAGLLNDAFACCKFDGRFVFLGFYPGEVSFNFTIPHTLQLRAFFPVFIGSPANREAVLRLMSTGKLAIEPLISHVVPWDKSEEVYNQLFGPARNDYNGIVFDWRTLS